ncbi:MAG: phosphodiesterase [Gammaproteobacteria bacterium]|nr:phosphodiesterase [Gammaproteobacteria bacterium]MXX29314.1 phosphodiesterase [Gammaproteobacteria bacterium]MXY06895.1 phosphodiesterase [Gammaproteobacteria bacterium]MYE52932.1 phosphodiesterase [Gammaproteobacteria bacterium]MYE86141.1 phosphodiesterase [Gammaproteobacteria bacterium]
MSAPRRTASVLQITDLHLLERPGAKLLGIDTTASLHAVLDVALAERRPAAMLVTGDIAHEPTLATYRRCLALLRQRFDGPLLCLAGNHDRLAPMLAAGLPTTPIVLDGWWLAGWDTHEDERPAARFDAASWQALGDWVAAAGPRGIVATHHPLIDVDCPWLDKDRLPNADELLQCLSKMASVKALVFGHAHQALDRRHGALPLLGTPSTCFQFRPRSDAFSIDDAAPGHRWLHLHDDGQVGTEVGRAEGFPMTIDLSRRKPAAH